MRTRPMRLFLPVAAPDIPSHKHSEIVKSWDYPEIPQIWSFFFHSFFGAYSFCPWLQRLKMCFLNMNEWVKDEMCHEITGLQQMGLKEKNAKIAVNCQCCLVSVRAESNLSHVAGQFTGWFCLPPGCHLDDSSFFWDLYNEVEALRALLKEAVLRLRNGSQIQLLGIQSWLLTWWKAHSHK